MKNFSVFIAILIFSLPQDLFSQDEKTGNFQVHVNYLNVKGKSRGGVDSGIGIGTEYHFNLVKSIGLEGLGSIGYDRIFGNCPLCDSEWFQHGFWAGIGVSKSFHISDRHKFLTQVRFRRVGFERKEAGLWELDGTVVRWEVANKAQDLFGFRLGYFLPIKLPVVLSYTFEDGAFHRMNSVALGFQF